MPGALLLTAVATAGVLLALPEAPPLAELFMELGLATIVGGTGLASALTAWSRARSDQPFPRSPVPPVLARLCPTCGCLAATNAGERPVCESCGAKRDPLAWHRDTPEPLLAFVIALVATGAALFVLGAFGSGRRGFEAFTTQLVHGASGAMTALLTGLAWLFFAHVAYASRRGVVGYVTGRSDEAHTWRAAARVDRAGALASAAGSARIQGKKRFVPPLSLARSEEATQALRALRKLAAHEKIAVHVVSHIAWQRTELTETITDDYRASGARDLCTQASEEPYVLAPTAAGAASSEAAWSRAIGLEPGGSSPLGAYLEWLEREPNARRWLVEAAAAIEAEEEAREEAAERDEASSLALSRRGRRPTAIE